MPIKLLPPRLANQIAAGEVVERPASVVKELVENSLDASADKIELDIEKGGHKRIRIRDNGIGIVKEELTLALSRHATSKIDSLNDLEQIMSLGFRGEALASISSVSRLTLTSKTASQNEAWEAYCEGREMAVSVKPAAHPIGTTIDVADLFYNTPARRKFLRTEKTEFQHIEDVIKRIALSRPECTFILKHNGKVIRRFQKHAQMVQRIAQVCGQRFIDNAYFVEAEYGEVGLRAWLGNENTMRSSSDNQYSFVNGRGMRDKLILHAIRQAYESVWGAMEQPSFVFYLDIPASDVDVNVHPAKHEVRFHQSRLIHDYIVKSVADALAENTDNQTAQGYLQTQEPQHDYIQPLTPAAVPSANAGSSYSAAGGASNLTGYGFSGGASFSHRGANHTVAQRNYQTLLTPPSGDENTENKICEWLNINAMHRLYILDEKVCLLNVLDLLPKWVSGQLASSSCSQPLLMPVVVDTDAISDAFMVFMSENHFVVKYNAGKVRLQQVPAGWRHLPWTRLFPSLVERQPNAIERLSDVFRVEENCWNNNNLKEMWHWFEQLSSAQQWESISEFGKVKALDSFISWWSD